MDRSTPGFPVHHQLLEFTQTHVYRVGDAIQPSHPPPSPSPPALNLSQHQGLFLSLPNGNLSRLSVNLLNGFDFPNAFPMILSPCVYHFTKTQLPKSQS